MVNLVQGSILSRLYNYVLRSNICRSFKRFSSIKEPLDAEILAEVYLEMHGGRQQNINLAANINKNSVDTEIYNYSKKIYEPTDQEKNKHKEILDFINNL